MQPRSRGLKRSKSNDDEQSISHPCFPDDLMIRAILPRLPMESLRKFKCVSKRWHGLITIVSLLRRRHGTYKALSVVLSKYTRGNKINRMFLLLDELNSEEWNISYVMKRAFSGAVAVAVNRAFYWKTNNCVLSFSLRDEKFTDINLPDHKLDYSMHSIYDYHLTKWQGTLALLATSRRGDNEFWQLSYDLADQRRKNCSNL
ncbi:hypothetical protein TIFTF001_005503 [Ficus carica]|uniref:F-box domain-containing protein n=1 Tax=Ficus carica TaxID=3494 RepID=A0AA87ZJT9_FICCA|nr:hypothetical protein TIFTF001_005503 [Ficus carica]